MSDLKLEPVYDSNGVFLYHDIVFELGKLQLVDGIDEIKNRILSGLNTYKGENYTNVSYGTDYYNNVFPNSTDDTTTIDELKSNILKTRGVIGLKTFSLSTPDSERVSVLSSQVLTTQGQIDLVTPIITFSRWDCQ